MKSLKSTKYLALLLFGILFSAITVFAGITFNIDDAFFDDTGIGSGNYSALNFNFNGNDFNGIVFLGSGSSNTGEITLGTQTISCDKQLEGLYINTARGNKVWPLDADTLLELSGSTTLSGYEDLTMTGGFFTQCTGTSIISSGIYGYVEHEYSGSIYKLWAGVEYDFGSGTATGNFDNNLFYITGTTLTASGYIFDLNGGIAQVYSNQSLYGNIAFTGTEVSLSGSSYTTSYTGIQVNIESSLDVEYTISGDIVNILTGDLTGGIAQDKSILLTSGAGSKDIVLILSGSSQVFTSSISVMLNYADSTSPTVELISPINAYSTTGTSVNFVWSGSDNIAIDHYDLYLSGDTTTSWTDITGTGRSVTSISEDEYTWRVVATDTSGNTRQSSSRTLTISGYNTPPNLISPENGTSALIGDLSLLWSGSSNSGYTWFIAADTGFSDVVNFGTTDNTGVDVINNPNFMTGTFYWLVMDLETEELSDYREINMTDIGITIDLEVDEFDLDDIDDADLSESYTSDEIEIDGITENIYVEIYLEDGVGALFVNDEMIGTTGRVKDGDSVYVELISSDEYDDRVSTTLVIGTGDDEVSDRFTVDTMSEENDPNNVELSYTQKLQAMVFLENIIDMYEGHPDRLQEFLETFQIMLQDKSDMLADDIDDASGNELELLQSKKASIDYLYDIIEDYLDEIPNESIEVYIAPNGKQYEVDYDANRHAYTSPDFMTTKYFPTRVLFTAHIDINNGGSSYHGAANIIAGNVITAPNNKVYNIYQINSKRSSDDFSYPKYFDSKQEIVNHIYVNNPSATWNHRIDTNFDPIVYTAPNGKRYTIFKTSSNGSNPNKYSSFGFVAAKYFDTLQSAKDHINIYNQ